MMKPINSHMKNEDVQLTIEGMSHEGLGVARLDGMAVFVQDALQGEEVMARLIKVAKTYAVARVLEWIVTSPERLEPFCPVYRRCGGCSLQHMTYAETLRFKRQVVVDSLERLGRLSGIEVKPVLGSEHPWRYRNKAQYPIGLEGNKPVSGFYARRSHTIVDASMCGIQHQASEKVREAVLAWVTENKVPVWDEETGKGLVRHAVARVGFGTGEVVAMVVATQSRIPAPEKLIRRLQAMVPGLVGIVLNVNQQPGNVVLGAENLILDGNPILLDKLCGLTFEVSPLSFYQVNPEQTEVLYRKTLEAAALKGTETVFDLYCGIGTISLAAAGFSKRVVGVEVVEEAVESAIENAKRNHIENVEFHLGKAEDIVPELYAKGIHADVVVVDPPRKGCASQLLVTILNMAPERILYVSCNPATLARDLHILCNDTAEGSRSSHGSPRYVIESVQPVDMFPWTEHVECVVLMTRVDK